MAWAILLWVGIGLLRTGKQAKGTPSKTKWQRNSADNLLEQGFDEPQASLAYAALARTATPAPPPRLQASQSSITQRFAATATKTPTRPIAPARTTGEYERVDNSGQRVIEPTSRSGPNWVRTDRFGRRCTTRQLWSAARSPWTGRCRPPTRSRTQGSSAFLWSVNMLISSPERQTGWLVSR